MKDDNFGFIKYLIAAVALLTLVGCAKSVQPQAQITIPPQLVNVPENTVVIPERPEPGPRYEKGDSLRVAVDKWVEHGTVLQAYELDLRDNLTQCTVDNAGMRENLHKIRQFILLNQQALPAN